MKILDEKQIRRKIERMAIQIIENNLYEDHIYLIGLNNCGYALAQMLFDKIESERPQWAQLGRIRIDPKNPLDPIYLDHRDSLPGQTVILVDDVANTGRTLFYCLRPLSKMMIQKVEIAVLVDRKHKLYPLYMNYVGLPLSTTSSEHVDVQIDRKPFQVLLS